MRKLIFTRVAATLVAAPMVTVVKAEDTTIIKRDRDHCSGRGVLLPGARLSPVNRRRALRPVLQSPRIQEASGPHHSTVISAFILRKPSRLPSSRFSRLRPSGCGLIYLTTSETVAVIP
jgi:hypothetical protein